MSWRIEQGDCLSALQSFDAGSVQTCVTSPPYWGLRDYGTAEWEGGDAECDHLRGSLVSQRSGLRNDGRAHAGPYEGEQNISTGMPYAEVCGKCGATRKDSQLGLEPTPEQYVENMVKVFREVRRVLRDDATLWLNLGDSYANPGHYKGNPGDHGTIGRPRQADQETAETRYRKEFGGLKNKDLCGIPWRVAFALQADGWYLRSDIIWAKPNPMPESVTDRPTRSHEYIFLLTKSARYFYDAEAVREDAIWAGDSRAGQGHIDYDGKRDGQPGQGQRAFVSISAGRNKRSVWTVTTQPYKEAHFATFPPKLIEPCVLAGSARDDTVLDPFCGAGTTGVVALRHDRDFIGIELNPEYCELARERIRQDGPLFNVASEAA